MMDDVFGTITLVMCALSVTLRRTHNVAILFPMIVLNTCAGHCICSMQ